MYQNKRPQAPQSPAHVFQAVILSLFMGMAAAVALLFTIVFPGPAKKLR